MASLDRWMSITQRIHADAAQQIQIAVALFIDEVHTLTAGKEDRIAFVCLQQQLRFGRLHGRKLHHALIHGFAHATSTSVPYAIFD